MTTTVLNSSGSFTFPDYVGFHQITLQGGTVRETMERHKGNAILLLEGGADISPGLYGEHNTHSYPSPFRDQREAEMYKIARELGIPILGICRGHQLMCALDGGALHQDIAHDLGKGHGGEHAILFTEAATESGFIDLMASNPRGRPNVVNSMHHQAIKRMPEHGVALAHHADGTPEAVLYPWGLSVQWHPEFMGHVEFLDFMRDTFLGEHNDHSIHDDRRGDRATAPIPSGDGGYGVVA